MTDNKSLLCALGCWAVFCLTGLYANLNPFEMTIFFGIFGITTWSWMTHWKQCQGFVYTVCTLLCVLASVIVIEPVEAAIIMATFFQFMIVFLVPKWSSK